MKISIIAAMDEKRGIGKDGKLPWNIPSELKHFKEITMGHPIIMGRKTYEAIGRSLPGRTNIIITRGKGEGGRGEVLVNSVEEALKIAKESSGSDEIFVIGGGQIFSQVMEKVDKLYLTLIEGDFKADTYFPEYSDFKKVIFEKSGEFEGLKYKFLDLER
ncbi:hypothetical protein A3F00_04390 [Candidatus Daviesbacteria bacterium RIFCSPHIGHO2_12_FULL_37_11]|uniref:Dihydrofolate reductase n=1 Tax=Candidatus Daviesbacteria bacterium RIFCSPHIGHO2_12_FULL_37_11 TaxID=1797777 RepID=A0A1F5K9N2_9BACT|nr:MAG: hypothetical protein A2769_03560 [Candidatus Daviesbacteria bacterium RIFCSPHIGHO2_01_FULL_37_27]OGE37662.1 MAG: hypothetical protein A3F00_04390 [Candidatus Daviesbacteria bacterium RIFCSPHIGHO2_12_FULL_37_11]